MSDVAVNDRLQRMRVLALIPFGIALNLGIGTLVSLTKVPLYLDAIATIAVSILAGWRAGIAVGVGSFLVGGLLVNPVLPWFSGTQAMISIYSSFVASRGWLSGFGGPRSFPSRLMTYLRLIAVGIGLGVVAGVISAPIIVWLFGGLTGSGPSLVAAFLLKSGETLFKAVLYSGLASEPLDKTIQLFVALALIRSLPNSLKASFGGPYLHKNGFLPS